MILVISWVHVVEGVLSDSHELAYCNGCDGDIGLPLHVALDLAEDVGA